MKRPEGSIPDAYRRRVKVWDFINGVEVGDWCGHRQPVLHLEPADDFWMLRCDACAFEEHRKSLKAERCELCGGRQTMPLRMWTEEFDVSRRADVIPDWQGTVVATVMRTCFSCEFDARGAIAFYELKARMYSVAGWIDVNSPLLLNPSAEDAITNAVLCWEHPSRGLYVEPNAPCLGEHLASPRTECSVCSEKTGVLTERVGVITYEEGTGVAVRTAEGAEGIIGGDVTVVRLAELCKECAMFWPDRHAPHITVRPDDEPQDAA